MATPSFDEFYSKVKARLPQASDELISSTYRQQFGADPVRTQGPTYEEFSAKVKASLPAADDALIRSTYDKEFGSGAATAAKRIVASQQAGSNKYIGALLGGLGTLARTVGMGDLAATGQVPAEDIGKTLTGGPAPGGLGESVFNYWDQVQQNNVPATALQGNVVDNPRLLTNPAFWAQGLGGAASFLGSIPQSLAASPKPAADLYLANKITGPQAVGLGAIETLLNVAPFGSASRLGNAALMGGATLATPAVEAGFTGEDMGQALKEGVTAAPFAALMGAALPVRPGARPEPPPGARDEILNRAQELTDPAPPAAEPAAVAPSNEGASSATAAPATPDYFNDQDRQRLAALPAPLRTGIESLYAQASDAKPAFDEAVSQIAGAVGGEPILAPLKGTKRAIDKIQNDYAGDFSQIKDLLRATIEVPDEQSAVAAIERIQSQFDVLPGARNLLDPTVTPLDGYKDAKVNVRLPNGHVAELQVNLPAMLRAKKKIHPLYQQRTDIERAANGREMTAEELQQRAALNAQMRQTVYEETNPAANGNALAKSSGESSVPLRESESQGNGLTDPSLLTARMDAPPDSVGLTTTGTPSTSNRPDPNADPNGVLNRSSVSGIPDSSTRSVPDQGLAGTTEFTTPTGRTYRARPELVELDQLLSSERPGYPAEVQPRQRDRASSQAQVDEMARGLRPDKLDIVVGPDNVVESGNGRTMALRRAAEQYPGSMAKYRAWLKSQGYDTTGMKHPVLVRRRVGDLSPADRAEFAREMNRNGKLTKGAAELALEDAAKLDSTVLSQLRPGEINSSGNAGFVRAFMQSMGASERGSLVDPDGALSADGIRRISNAVMAKAYGGDRLGNAVLARALESADNEVRSVTGAMLDAAPKFAELRQAIADGQVPAELDIGGKIAQAVEQTAKLRAERKGLADYLAQEDAFNPHDPVVADLMRTFYRPDGKRAAGREAVAAALEGYAYRALQQSLTQGDMLGGGQASAREIMASVLRDRPRESAPAQGRLVAEPQGSYKDLTKEQRYERGWIPRETFSSYEDATRAAGQDEIVKSMSGGATSGGPRRFGVFRRQPNAPEQGRLLSPTRAYAGKSVSSDDGQLTFDFAAFETRPDTTARQSELGRAALHDLISERDRRAGASVLAHGLAREFTEKGTATLVGQRVSSAGDLAALAQVYRDPRFETLRFFLMKGEQIVDQAGWTSRMPGAVGFDYQNLTSELKRRMSRAGADGLYVLHNHPAGKSTPSDADRFFTMELAKDVEGFRRHVVIDHNEYSTIDVLGRMETIPADFRGYDPVANPRVPHPELYGQLNNPRDIAQLAKRLQLNEDLVTLVTVDTKMRVRGIAEFPPQLLAEEGRGKARIARFERNSGGGGYTFAIGHPESLRAVLPLLKQGYLADSLQVIDKIVAKGEGGNMNPFAGTEGSVIRSKRNASTQVADEPPKAYTKDEPRESLMPGAENALGGGEYKLMQFSGLTPEELVTLTEAVDTLTPADIERQRRGERGWDATEQAAMKMIQQKYGITLDGLVNRKPGTAANAEQLEAYAQILAASTKRLTELAAEVNRSGSKEAKLALAAAKEKLGLMLAPALGYQTEAGRALNILRKTAKDFREASVMFEALGDGSEKALEDFAKRLGQATNPDQVLGVTRAAYTPTLWDKFYEYWINGLLSGPTTHAVNMVSNAMFQALDLSAQVAAGAVSRDVPLAAIKARVAGMVHGTTVGLKNAGRALLTGDPQIGGLTQVERPPAIPGRLGKVVRTPTRLLTAEDEMFKAVAYHGELAERAMRQAIAEKPANLRDRFDEILGGMLRDPATMRAARIAAERATFQTPLGDIGQAITLALNKSKVGRLIIPFVRTPTNILKRASEFTPAGYGMEAVKSALAKGGAEAAVAHARIAIGSGLMLSMIGLATQGMISGNGPQDPRERDLLMRQGWQPYSLKFGDRWYRYNRFDPVGMLMGLAADMHDIGAYASADDLDKLGSMVMTSIALNLGDKTFLRGITDFSQAYADPQRYANRWLQGMGSSMVPNILAQTARGVDPYMREAQTLMDAIKAKIPGMRESLAKKLDIAGEPVRQEWDVIGNPVQNSQQKPDALADAMLRLDVMKGKPARKLTVSGRAAELEDAEYEDYAAFVQQSRWKVLTPLVNSPQFQLLSRTNSDAAAKLLDQQYDRIGEQAKSLWLFKHPNVMGRLMQPKAPRAGSQYADQAAGTL